MTRLAIMIGIMMLALVVSLVISFYAMNIGLKGIEHVYMGSAEDMLKLTFLRDQLNAKNFQGAKTEWEEYLKLAQTQEVAPSQKTLIDSIQTQMREGESSSEQLSKSVLDLIVWHAKDSKKDYDNAIEEIGQIRFYLIIFFILALLFSILTALWISFSITKPLKTAVEAINQLTVGDLGIEILNPTKDEVGLLLSAMKSLSSSSKKMSDQLLALSQGDLTINVQKRSQEDILGASLETMVKNLRHMIGELQSEVTALTTSSQEIVGSVSQVATGSAETAAAVAETTTSVEELKQTAHLSDEKAKEVLRSAEETVQVVNASEKSLQTTIDDMGQINEKMRIISSGIIKLSEHSQTIREIIETVNDLAEQSNLLAVNAAIEAAKAGEHGKSFAVVAQEIRTLAEQSKAATVQVRSILNDIQNSTSEAVLATEQGSKAVEKGVSQSAETSESMQKLTQSMTKAAQMANEIADSSLQQLTGVDQVTVAMNNISEAASQHVENMKQIETAVFTLNSVGETLKSLINKYKINDA